MGADTKLWLETGVPAITMSRRHDSAGICGQTSYFGWSYLPGDGCGGYNMLMVRVGWVVAFIVCGWLQSQTNDAIVLPLLIMLTAPSQAFTTTHMIAPPWNCPMGLLLVVVCCTVLQLFISANRPGPCCQILQAKFILGSIFVPQTAIWTEWTSPLNWCHRGPGCFDRCGPVKKPFAPVNDINFAVRTFDITQS